MKRINLLFVVILLVAIALVAVACKDVKIEENTTPVENVDPRNQIYLSAVSAGYQGTYEEWLNSIKGDAIELKVADGYIQMKYKQETAWTNLLQLETLKGQNGVASNAQLQVANGYIQWKLEQDENWTNLIALSALTGEKGSQIELNVANGYLNYKYEDDTDWTELIELATLVGADGRDIELRANEGYVQWKYTTDSNWTNLYEYVQLDTYTVTFVTNTTETENPIQQNIKRLSKVVKPADPTKAGYIFAGWYFGDELWSFKNSVVTENMELQAHWNLDKCSITLDNQATGVSITGASYDGKYDCGSPILLKGNSIPDGYTVRWELNDNYLSSGEYCVLTAPNQDATIKATLVPVINNSKVYLGSYPQTRVTDSAITDVLNADTQDWTGFGYDTTSEEYMWYKDVEYNGNKYRGVYFTKYKISYGHSTTDSIVAQQDNNGYSNIKTATDAFWFKYEQIEWDVLKIENGNAMLISNKVINSQVYDVNDKNNYKESRIREWLNSTFYNEAFSEAQKSLIIETEVDNSAATTNSDTNQYACDNTNDKVYLLSYQEANTFYSSNNERMSVATDYARCEGVNCYGLNDRNYGYWQLRSPGSEHGDEAWGVIGAGVFNLPYTCASNVGTRPVIWVKV